MNPSILAWRRWFMRGPLFDFGGAFLAAFGLPATGTADRLGCLVTAAGGAPLDNLAVEAREWDACVARAAAARR